MNASAGNPPQAAIEAAWLKECGGRPPLQIWGTRGMVSSMMRTYSKKSPRTSATLA